MLEGEISLPNKTQLQAQVISFKEQLLHAQLVVVVEVGSEAVLVEVLNNSHHLTMFAMVVVRVVEVAAMFIKHQQLNSTQADVN